MITRDHGSKWGMLTGARMARTADFWMEIIFDGREACESTKVN
jgi:hypothetical protein